MTDTYGLPLAFLLTEAAIFGLILGSFLNVLICRIPQNRSILGRSACPLCGKAIPLYRNVPVFSFLIQGGKSACCGKPISWQYPIIEALTGFLSVVVFLHAHTLPHYFIWFCLFFCPLLTISIIDMQLRIIPDVISLPFILVGVGVQIFEQWPDFLGALKLSGLGILIGGGSLLLIAEIFSRIKKTEAMGGGDIKLAAMLGAFLGWKALIFVFFVSSILAVAYALVAMIVRRQLDRTLPFGPFLSLAAMIFWLYGLPITAWYFHAKGFSNNPFFP
jgi:leader peptidase (prepilin peptidase)/N-methyltransferase